MSAPYGALEIKNGDVGDLTDSSGMQGGPKTFMRRGPEFP